MKQVPTEGGGGSRWQAEKREEHVLIRKLRVAARDKEMKERALAKKLQVQPGEGGERMEDGRLELIEAARTQLGVTVEEIVESDGRCLDEGAGEGEESWGRDEEEVLQNACTTQCDSAIVR